MRPVIVNKFLTRELKGQERWRILRVFSVFSEHLQMKKTIQKIGSKNRHSLAINDKNCLYLYCFLMQWIYFLTLPNDFYLPAQA